MQTPATLLTQMRATAPLVQNITNYVAMNVMANVMLAAGASPAMVHASEEGAEFTELAQALTINIGTLDQSWLMAMQKAAAAMQGQGKPWVLDPVAVGATSFRRHAAAELLKYRPAVIRGNASEILALSGRSAMGRGADAADPVDAAESAARELAVNTGAVVAVTGVIDFVTDGTRACRIENGHVLMPRVTALGCALTGVVGAFCICGPTYDATIAALTYYGAAGEVAAKHATGPGSFQVAFIDALYAMTPDDLNTLARVNSL